VSGRISEAIDIVCRHCLAQNGNDGYNRRDDKLDRHKLRNRHDNASLHLCLQPERAPGDWGEIFYLNRP
jgi:hypothetical protein